MGILKRDILEGNKKEKISGVLQSCLVDLVDLALLSKQAHWNILGARFRSIHLHLDEIVDIARAGSDEVAERLATLGVPADGRAKTVAEKSRLEPAPSGFQDVEDTITYVADRMASTIFGLRKAIETAGEICPITEDLLIEISGGLEKQLWMLQAQEVESSKLKA